MRYFIILAIFLLASCQRENTNIISVEPVIKPAEEEVMGSISGEVTNILGEGIEGASVFVGEEETTTDENGLFLFNDIVLYADGTLVEIHKEGLFSGYKKVYVIENIENQVHFQLKEKSTIASFDGTTEYDLNLGQAQITLPKGSYASGASNTVGEMDIFGDWIEATDSNNCQRIPGDLTGFDTDGESIAILHYGILLLEIEDAGGKSVELPRETYAMLEWPLLDAYANEIDEENLYAWHFDEQNGTWLQGPKVELVNNTLQTAVRDLGYWTFGSSRPVHILSGCIKENGIEFMESSIHIRDKKSGFCAIQSNADNGQFNFRVPEGQDLLLEVYRECVTSINVQNVDALFEDKLLEITLSEETENIHIDGNIVTCSNLLNPNLYVHVEKGNEHLLVRADSDGSFDVDFFDCKNEMLHVNGLQIPAGISSEVISVGASNQISLGEIGICMDLLSGFNIDYENSDWDDKLLNGEVDHFWTVRKIQANNNKFIYSTKMKDTETGELYLDGVFIFEEGASTGDYIIRMDHQGFLVKGECLVTVNNDNEEISAVTFFDTSTNIEITNNVVYPGGISNVLFGLTYYD